MQELKTNINKNVITLTKFAEIFRNSPKFAENFISFFLLFQKNNLLLQQPMRAVRSDLRGQCDSPMQYATARRGINRFECSHFWYEKCELNHF